MNKGLEALRQYKRVICQQCQYYYGGVCNKKDECFSMIIEKELKALKIIKNKEVNVYIFMHSGDLETYNDMVEDNRKLAKEEYDLLKEVLL